MKSVSDLPPEKQSALADVIAKYKEKEKERQEKRKKRQTEGKRYTLRLDYHASYRGYDEEFTVVAFDLDDALDQIWEELADKHETDDVELDDPEILSEEPAQQKTSDSGKAE